MAAMSVLTGMKKMSPAWTIMEEELYQILAAWTILVSGMKLLLLVCNLFPSARTQC